LAVSRTLRARSCSLLRRMRSWNVGGRMNEGR
jgi:hypothetical protein